MKVLFEGNSFKIQEQEQDVLDAMYSAYTNLDDFIAACDKNRLGLIFDRKAVTLQDKQGVVSVGLKPINDYSYVANKSLVLQATNMVKYASGKESFLLFSAQVRVNFKDKGGVFADLYNGSKNLVAKFDPLQQFGWEIL